MKTLQSLLQSIGLTHTAWFLLSAAGFMIGYYFFVQWFAMLLPDKLWNPLADKVFGKEKYQILRVIVVFLLSYGFYLGAFVGGYIAFIAY